MSLNINIEVLWIFWRFWAARHISRANCTEINRDRQEQPAYAIFNIEHIFRRSKSQFSKFKKTSTRRHRRTGTA